MKDKSLEFLRYLIDQLGGRLPIISVGGIFKPRDVIECLSIGASLVQVYTGFVYQGPALLRQLSWGLLDHWSPDGQAKSKL